MAKGLNKVILIGHLGGDPEMRYTQQGTAIANFSLATSEQWKDRDTGEKKSKTEWHKIVAWRKLAEIMGEYLHKGDLVYIEGKLQTDKYDDKEGITRYVTKIVASSMLMLGTRGANQDGGGQPLPGQSSGPQESFGGPGVTPPDDDIPF